MLFLIVQTFIFLYPTCTQHSSATEIVMNMKDDYIIYSIAAENIISAPATSKSEWLNFSIIKMPCTLVCTTDWHCKRLCCIVSNIKTMKRVMNVEETTIQ